MSISDVVKSIRSLILLAPLALTAQAEVPVTDVGTSSSLPVRGGVAVDDNRGSDSAVTYGAASGYESQSAPQPERSSSYSNAGDTASRPVAGNTALFNQIKQMQEDIDTLRGQVEEQANELRKLKQQQTDDYANLDRRIGSGGTAPQTEAPASAGADNAGQDNATAGADTDSKPARKALPANTIAATSGDGKDEYEAAYGMLKAKNYDGAATKFKAIVTKYPNGDYTANSMYWLGQISVLKDNLDNAQQYFAKMIKQFPDHAKVPEAKYNLGKIYCQKGETAKGKALLKEVAAGDSKSAALAKAYLNTLQ